MLRKKILRSIIGAGILVVATASPAFANDVSISGTVQTYFLQYSGTKAASYGISADEAGGPDTYSSMATRFGESELKFKSKAETANGWKVKGEVELEIGQGGKNDFELEEASVTLDMGAISVTGGILEDPSTYTGEAYSIGLKEWDTKVKHSDESAAFRIGVNAVENLDLSIKLRFGEETNSGKNVVSNESRVRAKYDFGMGSVQVMQASLDDKPVDTNSSGDWGYAESNSSVMVSLSLGQISPWVEVLNTNQKETDASGDTDEEKGSQMILGADFQLNDQMTITGLYLTQSLDQGGSTNAEKTAISAGLLYAVKPAAFKFVYTTSSNNSSSVNSATKDAQSSGIEIGMFYKF